MKDQKKVKEEIISDGLLSSHRFQRAAPVDCRSVSFGNANHKQAVCENRTAAQICDILLHAWRIGGVPDIDAIAVFQWSSALHPSVLGYGFHVHSDNCDSFCIQQEEGKQERNIQHVLLHWTARNIDAKGGHSFWICICRSLLQTSLKKGAAVKKGIL